MMSSGARSFDPRAWNGRPPIKRDDARFAANGINLGPCGTYMRAVPEPRTGRVARNTRHVDSRIRIDKLSRTSCTLRLCKRADINAAHTFCTCKEFIPGFSYAREFDIKAISATLQIARSYCLQFKRTRKTSLDYVRLTRLFVRLTRLIYFQAASDTFIKFSAVQI